MAELILERDERLTLRADAHHLPVTVLLGTMGLTDAVIKEVDKALTAHGLIKVKVPTDEREERDEIYATLTDTLNAAGIQRIGKILVLYRPMPEKPKKQEPIVTPKKKVASKKPGEKRKFAPKKDAPVRRSRPKTKRVTKKSAMG